MAFTNDEGSSPVSLAADNELELDKHGPGCAVRIDPLRTFGEDARAYGRFAMQLIVNGNERQVPDSWRDETLLSTLREHLGLVGAKYSCGKGLCGACTVHLDGVPVNSCLLRTADAAGHAILTIEGLAESDGRLHPLQQAWIDERVPQCGYCQAGQIMRAAALLLATPNPSDAEIAAAMEDNLCRCGTYHRIRKAVRRAATRLAAADERAGG